MSETPNNAQSQAEELLDSIETLVDEFPLHEEPGAAAAAVRRRRKVRCAVSGAERSRKDVMAMNTLRPALAERIRRDHPELEESALISSAEIARYRQLYVEEVLREEHGEVTELERQVAESIANADTLAENVEEEFLENRSFGEIVSDKVASFGGSWAFILWFGAVMVGWMALNVIIGVDKAFDPYPFILLNLVLSTLAAIQAPIIMMSQRRTETKDRMRSLNDFQVNLKAELEIRHLHEKIDYLLTRQWQRMTEIQQLQLEVMQERKQRRAAPKRKRAKRRSVSEPGVEAVPAPGAATDEPMP